MERDAKTPQVAPSTSISTHTLTWSVTNKEMKVIEFTGDFNSHAHVERDLRYHMDMSRSNHFNSHAHVERDG